MRTSRAAGDVDGVDPVQDVSDAGVGLVRAPEHPFDLMDEVRPVELGDMEGSQHDAFGVPESQAGPGADLGRLFLSDIEGDRHRPDRAVRQAHPVADGLVVLLAQEAPQRGEPTVPQQFQVAELAGRKVPGGPVARLLFQLRCPWGVHDEVH